MYSEEREELDRVLGHHALRRAATNSKDAATSCRPAAGNLIDLSEKCSLGDFLADPKRETSNSVIPPLTEPAKEACILNVASCDGSVPDLIRIIAATPAGFHIALPAHPLAKRGYHFFQFFQEPDLSTGVPFGRPGECAVALFTRLSGRLWGGPSGLWTGNASSS